jgi:hypothetical protein
MIATRDIGKRAAELLARRDWSGINVVELQGPGDTSYDEVAGVLSEVLGLQLKHTQVGPDQMRAALTGMGMSEEAANAIIELSDGIEQGKVKFHEPRSESNTTPTTYPEFAQQVFKPAFDAS